jgi:hypothetical protein
MMRVLPFTQRRAAPVAIPIVAFVNAYISLPHREVLWP